MADLKKTFAPKKQKKVEVSPLWLGTMVLKFNLPMKLVDDINKAYDDNREKLKPWNPQLAGKIAEEKKVNEILTDEIRNTFENCFKTYVNFYTNTIGQERALWVCFPQIAWINEMKANGEYNPMHFHQSPVTDIGLSSVLMLKRPSTYGKEVGSDTIPTNGHLEFIGGGQTQLSIPQVKVDAKPGEFYVFPFSLMHGVYPFNGTDEVRRTLSCNCNLFKPTQLAKTEEEYSALIK
jgi:hypothetical protein